MKKTKSFSEWLKEWDEGNFDFTEATVGDLHKKSSHKETEANHAWSHHRIKRVERLEFRLFDKAYPFMAALLAIVMIFFLIMVVNDMPAFASALTPANQSEVITRYIEKGLEETGAVNIVAGVILDYRAFDTLGESHVLFTAASAVFILLSGIMDRTEADYSRRITLEDPILHKTAQVFVPLIILFGFYVILNGHIGPGGGFAGGAIIGGGLILYGMTYGQERLQRLINRTTYRITVVSALLFYGLAKCYSFFCGANHLETIFTTGTPGRIFSAGLILPLNIAVGIVVACTMYGFYRLFTRGRI